MTGSIASKKTELRYPWMFGKSVDTLFFFAPVLLGVGLVFTHNIFNHAGWLWTFLILNAFGAGPLHQGATWFAYFDKKNREYFVSTPANRFIFFFGPPLIIIASVFAAIYALQLFVAIGMIWALQHIVQQNIGILLLYHNHGRGEAIVARPLEARTQQFAACTFFLIFFYRVFLLGRAGEIVLPVIAVFALYTTFLIVKYLRTLGQQLRQGSYLNVPAFLFWCLSVLCLWPMAFVVNSFAEGYLIPVTVHWSQYLILNYVLVKNKYSEEQLKNICIPRPLLLLFSVCVTLLAINLFLQFGFDALTKHKLFLGICFGLMNGIGLVHFFQDAFLWRFRDPYLRQAILPHLMSERSL